MINVLNEINDRSKNSPKDFALECDGEYIKEIGRVAKIIADDDDLIIVAIAGPSSSGKTTTAHILCEELEKLGETTAVVSLDDFYLPYEDLPILSDGSKDIETVNSLDIPLIKKCFNDIINFGKTVIPSYDFKSKMRICAARTVDIGSRGILIVEGLHALNTVISEVVPRNNIYKIYISVNTPIVDDKGQKVLSSRQIRLIRRSLRDEIFRGSQVSETLALWRNVVESEEKYLYTFKDTADVKLVTLHPYELCVYRNRFCAMKQDVDPSDDCYSFFMKTACSLERFGSIDRKYVPKNSLIREFIGQDV